MFKTIALNILTALLDIVGALITICTLGIVCIEPGIRLRKYFEAQAFRALFNPNETLFTKLMQKYPAPSPTKRAWITVSGEDLIKNPDKVCKLCNKVVEDFQGIKAARSAYVLKPRVTGEHKKPVVEGYEYNGQTKTTRPLSQTPVDSADKEQA